MLTKEGMLGGESVGLSYSPMERESIWTGLTA